MKAGELAQIDPQAFADPRDLKAVNTLRKLTVIRDLLKSTSKIRLEDKLHAYHMRNGILLGPRQLPTLWQLINRVAERFGMSLPVAYVIFMGTPNAFAFGVERHGIVLTAELVDMMNGRELEAIIAHELAHILCEHMFYKQMGWAMVGSTTGKLTGKMPGLSLLMEGSALVAFRAWSRFAEYSADRAALLMLEDPEGLISCLSRFAGLPNRLVHEFDPFQFAEQAKDYDQQADWTLKVATWDMGLFSTHPEAARRAAAISEWSQSEQYRRILAGEYRTRYEASHQRQEIQIEGVPNCPHCHRPAKLGSTCGHCGLEQDPAQQTECPRGHIVSRKWSHCRSCGKKIG